MATVGTSKRRGNLYKKASELSTLCGAHVAIVTISKKGKLSMFPNSETVIQRYLSVKKRSSKSKSKSGSAKGLKNLGKKQSKEGAKKQALAEAAAAAAEMTEARDQVANVAAEEDVGAMTVVDPNQDHDKQFD